MPTLLLTHPVCLEHDTGSFHPECPDRLKAVMGALEREEFALLHRDVAPHATTQQLLLAHTMAHIDHVLGSVPRSDSHHHLDPDTVLSANSGEAALRAAGAVCAAVDAVAARQARNAFCAVRPPGHHAERDQAMGFCLFNNIAVGALHARAAHGFQRLAVIDFDVHHGNGTQHIVEDDPDIFYGSTHQANAYPGTGATDERGVADNVVNLPLPPGAQSHHFRAAMSESILPALRRFRPDFIFISAGFDAHISDPLAHLRLTTMDFHWITKELVAVAAECCGNRLVSALEGGYDLDALASSAAAHVRALMGS
jgi:acetoin utilization deacetylase AcuC-like enzyme